MELGNHVSSQTHRPGSSAYSSFCGALALIGLIAVTRGTPISYVVTLADSGPPAVGDSLFERTFELFTGAHISRGNRIVAVNNGSVYESLWRDLHGAQRTITVQMYYSLPGAVADSMAKILRERARAKVRVLFLVDAFGSQHLSKAYMKSLTDAGVEVARLRRVTGRRSRTDRIVPTCES